MSIIPQTLQTLTLSLCEYEHTYNKNATKQLPAHLKGSCFKLQCMY